MSFTYGVNAKNMNFSFPHYYLPESNNTLPRRHSIRTGQNGSFLNVTQSLSSNTLALKHKIEKWSGINSKERGHAWSTRASSFQSRSNYCHCWKSNQPEAAFSHRYCTIPWPASTLVQQFAFTETYIHLPAGIAATHTAVWVHTTCLTYQHETLVSTTSDQEATLKTINI